MKLLENAKALVSDSEIQEGTVNFIDDSISALLGDPVAAGKVIFALSKSPFFLRDKLFWMKFEQFLSGIDMEENERAEFCRKLTEDGSMGDSPYRLLQAIDHAETKEKINYLVNASRSLSAGFINLSTYFRICHVITNTIDEDLQFLSEHIQDSGDFKYSDTIQGLQNVGLMRQSVIDANGNDRFVFTPFANMVDQYAISFDNVNRYPMCGNAPPVERHVGTEITQLKWSDIM